MKAMKNLAVRQGMWLLIVELIQFC